MKRFRKYLSGEYELNKENLKKQENKKIENEKEAQIDKTKENIEKILKEYLGGKNFLKIIDKFIKIDNTLIDLNEIYVKKNTNKKFNFDYSIDFI